jgi:hypothetical protein
MIKSKPVYKSSKHLICDILVSEVGWIGLVDYWIQDCIVWLQRHSTEM